MYESIIAKDNINTTGSYTERCFRTPPMRFKVMINFGNSINAFPGSLIKNLISDQQ